MLVIGVGGRGEGEGCAPKKYASGKRRSFVAYLGLLLVLLVLVLLLLIGRLPAGLGVACGGGGGGGFRV